MDGCFFISRAFGHSKYISSRGIIKSSQRAKYEHLALSKSPPLQGEIKKLKEPSEISLFQVFLAYIEIAENA